jgi:hypothetical protein
MSKSLNFNVTLTFESAINDDNDIIEVARKKEVLNWKTIIQK